MDSERVLNANKDLNIRFNEINEENKYLNSTNNDLAKKYSILKSDSSSLSRLYLMAGLILVWGIRLCYVFWRRGYFKWGHEDHRWDELRKKLNYPEKKLYFHLVFNFFLY
jgi:hypothetical protein